MLQTVPCAKTRARRARRACRAARRQPLASRTFDGRLPANIRCGTSHSGFPSAATSSAVLPKASASVCAKTFATSRSWWLPSGFRRAAEADEVAGDQRRPLVDQLVEAVLPVRAGLAPVDRAGLVVDSGPVERDALAVRLHRQLLQVGREALQVLVVRQHGDGLRAEEVAVPDAEQAHAAPAGSARTARCGSARPSRGSRRAARWNRSGPIASIVERPIAESIE